MNVILIPEPGPELDAIVASIVLGWKENPPGVRGLGWLTHEGKFVGLTCVPRFSTDIGAAWVLVEWLKAKGWSFDLSWEDWNEKAGGPDEFAWGCAFSFYTNDSADYKYYFYQADTAELAICHAARLASLDEFWEKVEGKNG